MMGMGPASPIPRSTRLNWAARFRSQISLHANLNIPTQNIYVLGAYAAITLLMTYPWILHFTTHTPDWGGEGSYGLWNLWHFRYGLMHGSPFETDLLLPPYKLNLVFHAYTISRDLLALPLLSIFSLVLTSNLLTLLSFALSGLGMWLVVRDLTGNLPASFVAGLVYAFTPYRFAHLSGHYGLISIEWLAFYALYALRYFRAGHRADLALAAAFALLTSLTEYYYGLYLIVWSGLLALYRLIQDPERRKILGRIGLLAGTALLVHLPLVGLVYWGISRGGWVGRPAGAEMLEALSADLAGFITPSALHPVFGAWAGEFGRGWSTSFAEHTVYLGIIPLILILVGTAGMGRWSIAGRWWVLAFWAFLLLALGPVLHWRGTDLFPLPYGWFVDVPVFREARVPGRWVIMAIMSLAVMVGQVLAWIGQHWKGIAGPLYLAIALLILFEYLPAPLRLADRAIPLVYRTIAADPAPGSVLDMPFGINDSFTSLGGWNPGAMYFQTITARPIIGAHIARIPADVFEAYAQMPILGRLAKIENGDAYSSADVEADRQMRNELVQRLDLGFVVIPEWYAAEPGSDYILQVFDGCLEALPGDDRATGFRVLQPCP